MSLENDQKLYHMARLEISKVITGDKGEYRAVAKNKHGEGVATINLNFEGSGKPKYVEHFHLSPLPIEHNFIDFKLTSEFLMESHLDSRRNQLSDRREICL